MSTSKHLAKQLMLFTNRGKADIEHIEEIDFYLQALDDAKLSTVELHVNLELACQILAYMAGKHRDISVVVNPVVMPSCTIHMLAVG